jgi:hypothetical protein
MKVSESGQALLIAIFIGLLLLITIPVVVFVNTTGVLHHVASTNRDKGTAIAEEGIAYAQQLLSTSQANWNNYLTGALLPVECTNGQKVTGPDGGQFLLSCNTTDLRRQAYEVYVKSTAYLPSPQGLKPTRAIEAFFSRKTVAATFPTGQTVAAALAVGQAPSGGRLEVELGPIMCWDSNIWTLDAGLNTLYLQRPRKFAVSGITQRGTHVPPGTRPAESDSKEFWTYTYPGFNPVIDLTTYETRAANNSVCTNPAPPNCTVLAHCTPSAPNNCDFINVGNADTAIFPNNFTVTCGVAPCAIYVKGNAKFQGFLVPSAMNTTNTMAIIVDATGFPTPPTPTLTLDTNGDGVLPATTVWIPPTASADNPYNTCLPAQQCAGTTTNPIDFQGFIYTNGNLAVTSAQPWTIDGVVRVDGTTTLTPTAASPNILIYYNDLVNHNILTNDFQLMIDSQTEVTAQ